MIAIVKLKNGLGHVSQQGMTLIEAMFAILILLIVIIGSSYLFAYGKGQVSLRENYRSALELACQKLEQIKADDYDNIQQGETNENLSLGSLPCTVSTQVQDSNSYKNITTIVCWTQMGEQHDISLVTSIAPE
jgi:Tfp pilus assembly protein PilV